MATVASAEWTTENIKSLLDAMKKSISHRERDRIWSVGLKSLDWSDVAFEDFTAADCRAKWQEIMQKLRKIKSMSELIDDAQNAIDDRHSKLDPAKAGFPKRPVPANALYFAENKELFKKTNPGMNSRELMQFANDSYQKLSPENKEKYLQKAQKAKEEYKDNVKKLKALQKENLKRRRENTDTSTAFSNKKKKHFTLPKNGYNIFCHEQKSLLTGIPRKEITSVFSKRWKNLSEEEKKKYGRRCIEIKAEAERNGADFKQLHRKKIKRTLWSGEPKMPTRSICGLYCKDQMEKLKGEAKGTSARGLFVTASKESKNLSQQDKQKYQAIINKNFSMYKEQLQSWFEALTSDEQQEYCEQKPNYVKYLRRKTQVRTSRHRTSDSEDEDLEDSSGTDSDLTIVEVLSGEEGEENPMFDLF